MSNSTNVAPTVSDRIVALIRTIVPAAVGAVLAWLATRGLDVSDATAAQVVAIAMPVSTGAYYAAARWASDRWGWARYLLGYPAEPTYTATGGSR